MKQGEHPVISVIMTSHNHEDFIREAVESILNQSFSDFEFLIIDDGSTDATPDIVQNYARKDHRVKLVRIDHGGQSCALNMAVLLAQGDYLAVMDSDDVSLPDRLETQYAWIRENNCALCGSQVETFGDEQKLYWYPESREAVCVEQLFRVAMIQGTMMMRSNIARENPYRKDIKLMDYEWPTRISFRYRLGNVPKVLLKRRRHGNQTSVLHSEQCAKEFSRIHFQYFYSLFPQAGLKDYLALFRIAGDESMTSLSEMERAGQWLVELSRHSDKRLRHSMAHRWKKVAERSSVLGNEYQNLFERYHPKIMQYDGLAKHPV